MCLTELSQFYYLVIIKLSLQQSLKNIKPEKSGMSESFCIPDTPI